jgi:hypothetical protein
MSRAFVKEDGGGRWEPVAEARAYRVVWAGAGEREVLRESDDLLELLTWAQSRPAGAFDVTGAGGELLAQVWAA